MVEDDLDNDEEVRLFTFVGALYGTVYREICLSLVYRLLHLNFHSLCSDWRPPTVPRPDKGSKSSRDVDWKVYEVDDGALRELQEKFSTMWTCTTI